MVLEQKVLHIQFQGLASGAVIAAKEIATCQRPDYMYLSVGKELGLVRKVIGEDVPEARPNETADFVLMDPAVHLTVQ